MDSRILAMWSIRDNDTLANTLRPVNMPGAREDILEAPVEMPSYVKEAWEDAFAGAKFVRKEMARDPFGDPIGGLQGCTSWRYLDCALLLWIGECLVQGGPVAHLDGVRKQLDWCRVFCDTLADIPFCQSLGFKVPCSENT